MRISIKEWILVLLTALVSYGCAIEPTQRAQRIIPAYPETVSDCALLGGVNGNSLIAALPVGEQVARYRALDEAASLGATHIVWTVTSNGLIPLAEGRAYYCDPDRAMPDSYRYIEQYLRAHRYPYDGE